MEGLRTPLPESSYWKAAFLDRYDWSGTISKRILVNRNSTNQWLTSVHVRCRWRRENLTKPRKTLGPNLPLSVRYLRSHCMLPATHFRCRMTLVCFTVDYYHPSSFLILQYSLRSRVISTDGFVNLQRELLSRRPELEELVAVPTRPANDNLMSLSVQESGLHDIPLPLSSKTPPAYVDT